MEPLRGHLEKQHGDRIKKLGVKTVNNIIFWRAKQGLRKVSKTRVDEVIKKICLNPKARKLCQTIAKHVLHACLVEIVDSAEY